MSRKLLITLFFLLNLSAFIFIPSGAYAADLGIGATTWYTAWDYEDDIDSGAEYSPAFLYGPVLSLTMTEKLSLSFVFLYGEFDLDTGNQTQPLKRYDSDLAMNYRISNYFKIFLGVKCVGFTWDPDGKHLALGPGAGISAVFPIGGNFFILGYLSGLYLKGKEEGKQSTDYSEKANEYGGNGSLSLAYYIPSASTTISLGGRYQYLEIKYDSDNGGMTPDSTSRFYGVTLSAVYSFNI